MALTKHGMRANGLSFLRDQNVERERGERKREKKRKRKRRRGEAKIKKVWKLTLIMDSMRFGMDLWFCMVIILPQTQGLLGFHPNQRCIEIRVGKTQKGTR